MVRILLALIATVISASAIFSQEVKWTTWAKVKEFNRPALGKTLNDIESHIQSGHQYSFPNMPMTWAHETTHGINANIRNRFFKVKPVQSGFYCLESRAVLIEEPKTTISRFSSKIPRSLRGPSYDLYLKKQAQHWNNSPLYILDEWIAYTNGTSTGQEVQEDGWFYELLQAHNFNVYSIYLAQQVEEDCPNYDSTQLKAFIKWNTERVFEYTSRSVQNPTNKLDRVNTYLEALKNSSEAEPIRIFSRKYFGEDWCKRIYNF